MSCKHFKNVNIYNLEQRRFFLGSINICGELITDFEEMAGAVDLDGAFLIPGIIDQHSHGRGGFDFNSASSDEMLRMRELYLKAGTSTVIPTLASAPFDELISSIEKIKATGFDGVHLEGRYLNPTKRGAHSPELIAPLDTNEINVLLDHAEPIRMHISAAFEQENGREFARAARERGATLSLGHSNATFDEAMETLDFGVSSFTHLFNAMRPFTHREPGTAGAGLLSSAYVELICDGFHLHPETVRLVQKTKPLDEIILISDSMSATGCEDGEYSIAGMPVHVRGGRALGDDGTIMGSTLNLFDGLFNFMKFCNITLEEALPCVTANPARLLSIDRFTGDIASGKRADLCILAPDKRTLLAVASRGKFVTTEALNNISIKEYLENEG